MERKKVIVTIGLVAICTFILYKTGVFTNIGMFLAVGALPGGQLDSTTLLAILAVLLVAIGYGLGFSHGVFHQSVRHHLAALQARPRRATNSVVRPVVKPAHRHRATEPQSRALLSRRTAPQIVNRADMKRAKNKARRATLRMRRKARQWLRTEWRQLQHGWRQTRRRMRFFVLHTSYSARLFAAWGLPYVGRRVHQILQLLGKAVHAAFLWLERLFIWMRS